MKKQLLGYDTVLLPSGLRIRGVRPTAQEIIRRGLWPTDLRVIAMLGASGVRDEATTEERAAYVETQHITVAAYVRQEWDDEDKTWNRVAYTPEEVHDFHPDDLDMLEDIVLRRKTAEQVTLLSEVTLGMREPEEATVLLEREGVSTVTGWAEFREDADSVTAGSDSGDVAAAPVGDAPSGGRRARTGSGRGTGAPAGER